jgi:hypothetical protein
MMPRLATRLNQHFAPCAAMALAIGTAGRTVDAAIHWHSVNLNIPSTLDGLYLNVVSGAHGNTSGAVPGWTLNGACPPSAPQIKTATAL